MGLIVVEELLLLRKRFRSDGSVIEMPSTGSDDDRSHVWSGEGNFVVALGLIVTQGSDEERQLLDLALNAVGVQGVEVRQVKFGITSGCSHFSGSHEYLRRR